MFRGEVKARNTRHLAPFKSWLLVLGNARSKNVLTNTWYWNAMALDARRHQEQDHFCHVRRLRDLLVRVLNA